MKILFATGRSLFPFFRGGDGTTAHQLMKGLYTYGIACRSVGVLDPISTAFRESDIYNCLGELNIKYSTTNTGIKYVYDFEHLLFKRYNFLHNLESYLVDFAPDIVITQLEESASVINLATSLNIRTILYVHDITQHNHLSLLTPGLSYVFYNSNFVSNFFTAYHYIPHKTIYPVMDESLYRANSYHKEFITFINPIEAKGAKILEYCIRNFVNVPKVRQL